ncbi:phosphate starvation inducible protein [Hyphomicrobium denitrificans 1NES1]|uniref:PhoH-like protein n=1 Tax=Hyphomicrobium denitrificans 1NES1 TaxID=670307 RepID=N0B8N8_9HYPH|nr:PhoH family protein [Hyphomicrobium denitrificans]AGK59974.1 phosphate starvation inducible protein [Hyphomicrobium denitrificans 1NES1]
MAAFRGASAPASRRPNKPEQETARIVVPFEDNRLLTQLLGEYDSHLALIEDRLGIDAHAHGNVVILTGATNSCDIARNVLEKLYARIAKGETVGAGDIDGLIRHSRSEGTVTDGQAQIATRRRVVKARTPTQSIYIRSIEKRDLVFGLGPAGTGKTYIAVAFAAHCLERGLVERIILSRPAVEAGERLGFLPGDMRDKVDPYLRPLYDALYDVLPPEKVERDIETGVVEIAPLAFMRGRTLSNAFVILDEAQNTTSMQMKMFLTRIGEGSKMVVTGDPSQIDLPFGTKSGLVEAVDLLSEVDDISIIRFEAGDIVRRDLVAKIVDAYEKPKHG